MKFEHTEGEYMEIQGYKSDCHSIVCDSVSYLESFGT